MTTIRGFSSVCTDNYYYYISFLPFAYESGRRLHRYSS